jgi:amino acid transporter
MADPVKQAHPSSKLSMLPLVALIFFEVSGGPFGVEDSVKAGGPLLALLGFLVFPFIWSIPEALVTAELATTFPENGGYVVWIAAAFGPFWGFQEGWWKWLSGVIDNALYPVLFLDYLKRALPIFGEGPYRLIALIVIIVGLTYLNYRGLTIVGYTAVALTVFSLLPFAIMSIMAVPLIQPKRWLVSDVKDVNWRLYLNTLFWNLNYWDSASTLAGEVENPKKTFPKALFLAVLLVVFGYFIPLLAGTGAVAGSSDWDDGHFADVAMVIGGVWLKWWVEIAAAVSNMGLFEAEMSSDSFQLLGMGEIGMLPEVFAVRSQHGTPILGILCSASGVVLLSWMSFQEIIEVLNFLYCFGMLLEFAALIWLRVKQPDLLRPYQIPLSTKGVTALLLLPTVLLLVVMAIASTPTILLSMAISLVGFLAYPALAYAKDRRWLNFTVSLELPTTAAGDAMSMAPGSEYHENLESETLLHTQKGPIQTEIQ